MSRQREWMPFFVGDYLADTQHLSPAQHGAYMLLIFHYWQTGGLPDEDAQLARIARCTPGEWRKMRAVLAAFFEPGWKHGRVEKELAKASAISEKRRGAAEEMHSNRRANADANAPPMQPHLHLHPPLQSNSSFGGGGGKEADRWTPPGHGATSTRKGRVYIRTGTPEWEAYAADYREVHLADPVPNAYGGKWFNIAGENRNAG